MKSNIIIALLIFAVVLLAGNIVLTYAPIIVKHNYTCMSPIQTNDGVNAVIKWTASYKGLLNMNRVDKENVERQIAVYGMIRLNLFTRNYNGIDLYNTPVDVLQKKLDEDDYVRRLLKDTKEADKLKDLVNFRINELTFNSDFLEILKHKDVAKNQLDSALLKIYNTKYSY